MGNDDKLRFYYLLYKKGKWRVRALFKRAQIAIIFRLGKRKKPEIPKTTKGLQMIHIGCGRINIPGFINIDPIPYSHVHYVTDKLTDLSMFANESIDLIYMSHVLEHIGIREVESVIWEMNRVLKKGGILRISVPDFEKLAVIYHSEGSDIKAINYYLMGNQDHQYNFHHSIYSKKYLINILMEMGFSKVEEWDPQNCSDHDFRDESLSKLTTKNGKEYLVSLNLEGIK